MRQAKLIFAILVLYTFQGCNYRLIQAETTDGKKVWIKDYKDPEVARKKSDIAIFKNRKHEKRFNKYPGKISTGVENGQTFVLFDSIKVYLLPEYGNFANIFRSGLVSGQMIFCAMDSNCNPPTPMILMSYDSSTGKYSEDTQEVNMSNRWLKHNITISYMKEFKDLKSKASERRFEFWVAENGGADVLYLELKNKDANKSTDFNSFIKGSHVTFFRKVWIQM